MYLPPDAWYTRWFFWSADVVYEWTRKRSAWQYQKYDGTNLCQFIRVTWVWAPLIILAHVVVIGLWIHALIIYPIRSFGLASWGSVVAGIVIGVSIIAGAIWLSISFKRQITRMTDASQSAVVNKVTERVRNTTAPSYASVVWMWIVAKKRKICPTIKFTPEVSDASL